MGSPDLWLLRAGLNRALEKIKPVGIFKKKTIVQKTI